MKKTLIIIAVSMLALMAVAYAAADIPKSGPFQELKEMIIGLEGRVGALESEVGCVDEDTRPCGSDVGACKSGTETCVSGFWEGICDGEIVPIEEIPNNNLDDDCDGKVDEALTCTDGEQNQDETDTDCGGDTCPKCENLMGCIDKDDCLSEYCDLSTKTCRSLG